MSAAPACLFVKHDACLTRCADRDYKSKTGGGTMSINNVLTTSGGTIVVLEGTFAGDGSVNANVNNERGTISPGNSSSASGPGSAVPEPCGFPLLAVGLSVLLRSRWRS